MDLNLGQLRQVMHQQYAPDKRRLRPPSYLEAAQERVDSITDISELYHENTKYHPDLLDTVRRSAAIFERPAFRSIQTAIGGDYPDHQLIELPKSTDMRTPTLWNALQMRRSHRSFADEPIPIDSLAQSLHAATGITSSMPVPVNQDDTASKPLRAYPSAGALYPVELYVLIRRCQTVAPGIYYYSPEQHGFRVLENDPPSFEARIEAVFLGSTGVETAPVQIVLTGAFWRAKTKYGPRAYRYILQEAGHVAQNLQLAARARGLATVPVGGFFDDRLNELLGHDGIDEAAVYVVSMGVHDDRKEDT